MKRAVRRGASREQHVPAMSRLVCVSVLLLCGCWAPSAARPVRRTLNFNMFLLQPNKSRPDRFLLTTDGVSRFGPLLEYFIQRVQGMMSVRVPEHYQQHQFTNEVPLADAAENEVDSGPESRVVPGVPGVVVRPSQTKPGTYEVEINVVVDDGKPDDRNMKSQPV